MRKGLLLINLGTPNSADIGAVKSYLREFLTDKRVIDLPALPRHLLVNLFIIPFRSKKSAHAYSTIWTEQGSPLLTYSQKVLQQIQNSVGSEYQCALGMRYGNPSITTALDQLKDCDSIAVLPLYPQYSSAATGSSIEEVMRVFSKREVIPSFTVIRDFYQHPSYIKAQSQIIKNHLHNQDFLLFSYHGIPERQIRKSGCNLVCQDICPKISETNKACYKAQCYQTSSLLAEQLGLNTDQYITSFQSRLGKTPWIKPYTDEVLAELAAKGIKNLAVVCPSFVSDCLETLEEIGMRSKEQWYQLGGEQFTLIPCMNDSNEWIEAIVEIAKG